MKAELFEALDRAMKAGTEKALKPAQIAGKGADAEHVILKELCASGFLASAVKGKNTTYTVTEAGKTEYERQNAPERIDARKQEQQKKEMLAFLKAVEEAKGKKLPANPKYSVELIEAAKNAKYVAPLKANVFQLLPQAETVLFGGKPITEQLVFLKQSHRQLLERMQATQQKAKEELYSIQGESGLELKSIFETMEDRNKQASEQLATALVEIAGVSTIVAAASRFQAALEESRNLAAQELKKDAEQAKSNESHLKQTIVTDLRKIEEEVRHLSERMTATEAKAHEVLKSEKSHSEPHSTQHHPHAENHAHTEPKKESHAAPTDAAIWESTKKEFDALHSHIERMGGIVKIPELTDAVRKHFDELTVAHFHELLQQWGRNGKLTLQLCSTTDKEPRADEGIHSPTGLLFYVTIPH